MFTRQAPHIPVPSTINVFNDTTVGILYGRVKSETAFIIGNGPIAYTKLSSLVCLAVSSP